MNNQENDIFINEDEIHKLGKWEDVYTMPTRMTLESFWYTMEKWSLNPQYMNKSVKKYSLTNKSTYDKDNKLITKHIYQKNLSGTFYNGDESITTTTTESEETNESSEQEEDKKPTKKQKHSHHGCENDEDEDDNIFADQKDINTKDIDESELAKEYLDQECNTIIYKRHLIPRLTNRDPTLDELIYHRKSSHQCQFIPIISDSNNSKLLPFFYPKVLGFNILYQQLNPVTDKDIINNLMVAEKQQQLQSKNKKKQEASKKEDTTSGLPIFKAILKVQVIYFKEFQPKFDKTSKQILGKLDRWGINFEIGYKKKANLDQLVPKNEFIQQYEEMKSRYKNLEANWLEITKTDPQKFIYEDVAIAAYLICLWRNESGKSNNTDGKKQTFIDLGCGNGLLVYILNKEGYDGIGIDLRCRKIWKQYDDQVQGNLIEEAIQPKDTEYSKYDWIIGNHSDELTPWIPYITSKTKNQKFFLLPCCFFNFSARFTQNDTRIGRYSCYLNYIEKVSKELGFNVTKETLRIPSTKNIAFVSTVRDQTLTDDQLIETRSKLLKSSNFIDFKPRERDVKWVAQKKYQQGKYNPHLDPSNPDNKSRIERKNNYDNSKSSTVTDNKDV